jgi:putative ABC transport system permease protein
VRLYRRALVVLPRRFRRQNGNAMVAMIADEWRDVRGLQRISFVLRSAFDLLWTAVAERASRWRNGHVGPGGRGPAPRRFLSSVSALDIKLGVRMLAKYPGLSLVSVLGMAVAIAIGAGVFSLIAALMTTTVPLPQGERVVGVHNVLVTRPTLTRASLRDFNAWRTELKSVQDLAAFTTVQRNLVTSPADVDLVRVVRMTASGFALTRTAPLLGRTLLDEDERNDARVVVIAYEEWQNRFAADPNILGRTVKFGSDEFTIIGVMQAEFGFPINDRFWIPLVFSPAERADEDAVTLTIAGRLARGATFESTQAELNSIGSRMAAAYPDTHQQLRPRVVPYPRAIIDIGETRETVLALNAFRFAISLLLMVVAVNVAILVYARTATRTGEIAVRTALGASRARVVTQLFAEALVLSLTAALVGLAIASVTLNKLQQVAEHQLAERRLGQLPFWI